MRLKNRYALLLIGNEGSKRELEIFLSFNNIPKDLEILNYTITKNFSKIEQSNCCGHVVKNIYGNLRATSDIIHYLIKEVTNKTYLLYCHHDAFNLTFDGYYMIDDLLDTYDFTNIGLAGFNIYHDEMEISQWNSKLRNYQTTCRTPFEQGDGYYRERPSSSVNYANFIRDKSFEIAIPMWSTCLINLKLFKEEIPQKSPFDFFFSMDDIAVQFLKRDKNNVCFPEICFSHQQSTKKYLNQITKSPKAAGGSKYGRTDHADKWDLAHGYRWNVRKYFFGLILSHYVLGRLGTRVQYFLSFLETVSRYDIRKKNLAKLSPKELQFYNNNPRAGPIAYVEKN